MANNVENQYKTCRKEAGLTQKSAILRLLLPDEKVLSFYENGHRLPDSGTVSRMVKHYRRYKLLFWHARNVMPELAEHLPETKDIPSIGEAHFELSKALEDIDETMAIMKRDASKAFEYAGKIKSAMDKAASVYAYIAGNGDGAA